jgi:hypothetical protein
MPKRIRGKQSKCEGLDCYGRGAWTVMAEILICNFSGIRDRVDCKGNEQNISPSRWSGTNRNTPHKGNLVLIIDLCIK